MKKTYAIIGVIIAIIFTLIIPNKVQAATGKVTTETLNLRSEPSTSSSILELLDANEEVEVISEEGDWYKVEYNGEEGYVSKDYIEVSGEIEEEPSTNNTETTDPEENNNNEETTTYTEATLKKDADIKILPLINSNIIGNAKAEEKVIVLAKTNNWTFIETNEIAGWVTNSALGEEMTTNSTTIPEETNNEEQPSEEAPNEDNNEENIEDTNSEEHKGETSSDIIHQESSTKYVNGDSVYVRSEPTTDSSVVTTLIKNTDVTVIGENGEWYKIKFADYSGYMHKTLLSDTKIEETSRNSATVDRTQYAETSNNTTAEDTNQNTASSSKGEEIVAYAKQYLGCPYVYGGSGSSSFDCSGFTMYVYKHFGYSLSHSAIAQSNRGTYVAKEDLQPGDLVFFLEWDTMDEIGHCGIYIGNGEFIHASSGSGYCIKISDLTSGSYAKRYATARRLI